jgi:hypothetical protein
MKKYIFLLLMAAICGIVACNPKSESNMATASGGGSTIALPYVANYSTDFNNNVSDSDLLTTLNSYKAWENGDMKALRATLADTTAAYLADGFKFSGSADSLIKFFGETRDSLSSVNIKMDVWLKNHSVKDSINYINVWYKEIDTYKNGKIDSTYYEDDNGMKGGKIIWYSQHKQVLK